MTINIVVVNKDKVEFKVLKPDKTVLDGSKGYSVTVEQAMDECKDMIDWELDR